MDSFNHRCLPVLTVPVEPLCSGHWPVLFSWPLSICAFAHVREMSSSPPAVAVVAWSLISTIKRSNSMCVCVCRWPFLVTLSLSLWLFLVWSLLAFTACNLSVIAPPGSSRTICNWQLPKLQQTLPVVWAVVCTSVCTGEKGAGFSHIPSHSTTYGHYTRNAPICRHRHFCTAPMSNWGWCCYRCEALYRKVHFAKNRDQLIFY